jgi:NAD(P)-dependent dehydrogenase (short-subunit alcohol dehydrogenase family)
MDELNISATRDLWSLEGQTALVTGATGHLGLPMCFALGNAGARVLVNGRRREAVDTAVGSLLSSGIDAKAAVFDVTDQFAVTNFFREFAGSSLNVIVNNAYEGGAGSIETSVSSSYGKAYESIVESAQRLVMLGLPALRLGLADCGNASVINIASMYAMVSPDLSIYESKTKANPPFYGAAKAALIQWTRYAACEFGAEGLRFNAISPGPFPNDKVRKTDTGLVERIAKKVPLGRVGEREEICGPVLFLASRAASFVTGSNLIVDGGWTAW